MPGPDGAEGVARPFGRAELVADAADDLCGEPVQFARAVGEAEFGEDDVVRAEGAAIDGIDAGFVEHAEDAFEDCRAGRR